MALWKRRSRVAATALAGIGLGTLAACGDAGSEGDLSNGRFQYICSNESDLACDFSASGLMIPDSLALGSEFGVEYSGDTPETEDGIEFQVTVVPASTSLVEIITTESFRAAAAGNAALLGRGSNGVIADFFHLYIVPIETIELRLDSIPIPADLELSEARTILAIPLDDDGDPLGGAVDYSFSIDDPSIVELAPGELKSEARLTPVGSGTAILTVEAPGVTRTLSITVDGGTQ